MPSDTRVTDSQDEQNYEDLFRDNDQIHVPLFQRPYVWTNKELTTLQDDIQVVLDGQESSQFLGAVVTYERPRDPNVTGRIKAVDVVDGQQRLITLTLYVAAIAEVMSSLDAEMAWRIIDDHLLVARTGLSVNTRIIPSISDRKQFHQVCERLNDSVHGVPESKKILAPQSGSESPADGRLLKQYMRMLKEMRALSKLADGECIEDAKSRLEGRLEVLIGSLQVVVLKLNDPSSANKIFQRLNYAGVQVDILGLVRNEVFSRLVDPRQTERIFQESWQPFELRLGEKGAGLFFPYCLIHKSSTTKSEMFSTLRELWKDHNSPEEIVHHLDPFADSYLALVTGDTSTFNDIAHVYIQRFYAMKCPAAAYPFLMQLLLAKQSDDIGDQDFEDLMNAVESFLIRRLICGFEPTGLHALFKSLWIDMRDNRSLDKFRQLVNVRGTIHWPTPEDVRKSIRERQLYKSKICNYLLVELDRLLPGDDPSEAPSVEHILPQTIEDGSPWAEIFSTEDHHRYRHTLANLVPLTQELNSSLSNQAYSDKASRFRSESMFKTPRLLAAEFPDIWDPDAIEARSEQIANQALQRWCH